jgi:serine/threonine protein phosphatase PrpC
MSLALHAAAVTDIGLVRTNNEDSVHAGRRLIAVADGIGGMPAGELASDIVIKALAPLDRDPALADPVAALMDAVAAANEDIRAACESDESQDGMGTTVTAMLIAGEQIGLMHVGDSRGYLFRDDTLTQLTKDDTFVQSLVDQGLLTLAEARIHPRRSIVTQAIQGSDFQSTTSLLQAKPGDRLLVCSDGLSDALEDEQLWQVLRSSADPAGCAGHLVAMALSAGATDNVTVAVADVVVDNGGPG